MMFSPECKKKNILLTISYDGTNYLGWQKTASGPSIEETLEKALSQILQIKCPLQAASRTDRGVHARRQKVNFFLPNELFDLKKLKKSLNSLLPKDISVLDIEPKPLDFHPTLHCIKKEYHYYICNSSSLLPHERFFFWKYPKPLDREKMEKAKFFLLGFLDFSAFSNEKKDFAFRHLFRIDFHDLADNKFRIEIEGNSFLYNMVRILVGTLVYIGNGKIPLEQLETILKNKERKFAGITAPAHGLFLENVYYET